MATLTVTTPAQPSRTDFRWIVSKGIDLPLIIGSSLAGYVYLFLFAALQVPISYLWWFWSVGFDGTHIFAMASRTFFDREERRKRRVLLFGSLVFFFSIGPLMILAGWKPALALAVGTWAYYHVVRQHYGFLMLYKVKNRDMAPIDNRLDRLFLGVMLIAPPFHRFFVHHPRELGIPERFALDRVLPAFEPCLWVTVGLVGGWYAWRQLSRLWRGEPLNYPKLLLLASVVSLHWATFAYMSWQAAVPSVTIGHNLQYHALVLFYNRNKYGKAESAEASYGWIPKWAGSSLTGYILLALAFSLAYRLPGFQLGRVSDLAFGFFCGFGLTHYYLDSRIWRVRHDPQLREALQLG